MVMRIESLLVWAKRDGCGCWVIEAGDHAARRGGRVGGALRTAAARPRASGVTSRAGGGRGGGVGVFGGCQRVAQGFGLGADHGSGLDEFEQGVGAAGAAEAFAD